MAGGPLKPVATRAASSPFPATAASDGRSSPPTPVVEVTPLRSPVPAAVHGPLPSASGEPGDGGGDGGLGPSYTVGDAIDKIGFGRFHVILLALAGAAWAADAMEMMLLSFLGPAARCEWGLSSGQETALSASVFAGMMVGAYGWGALSDAAGRRTAFFVPALFTFAAGILSATARSFGSLVAARAAVGVGLGGAPVAFALFMEFSPSPSRGLALVALQAFWTVGSVAEAGLAWAVLGRLGWRWLVALSSIPLLALACLIPFVPESPFYLASAGRAADAEKVLTRLARANRVAPPAGRLVVPVHGGGSHHTLLPGSHDGGDGVPANPALAGSTARLFSGGSGEGAAPKPGHPPLAPVARHRLGHAIDAAARAGARVAELLHPTVRRNTAVLAVLWLVNALAYYSLVLLSTSTREGSGDGELKPGLCQPRGRLRYSTRDMAAIFIDACAELPGLVIAALAIDLVGRRITLGGALAVLAASTTALAATRDGSTGGEAALFIARGAAMASYCALYVVTPESYPTRVRSLALGLNSALSRVGALVSPALAVSAVRAGRSTVAEGALAAAAGVAALCAAGLKAETAGVQLPEEEANVGAVLSPAQVRVQRVISSAASAPLPAIARLSTAMRSSMDAIRPDHLHHHGGGGLGRRSLSPRRRVVEVASSPAPPPPVGGGV